MAIKWLILSAALLFPATAKAYTSSGAGPVEVTSIGNDFRQFLKETEGKTPFAKKLSAWEALEAKHPGVFPQFIYGGEKEESLKDYFKTLPQTQDKILEYFEAAPNIIQQTANRFRAAFPDYSAGLKISIALSLNRFNAATGNGYILFGMDGLIALNNRPDELPKIVSHEMTHAYLFSKAPEPDSFGGMLWHEGLATHVSAQLNPQLSDEMLFEPVLAKRCADPAYVKALAKDFRKLLRASKRCGVADIIKTEWFIYQDDATEAEPSRKGYCLGLHAVRKLAQTHTIPEMANLQERDYLKLLDSTLAEMAE